VPDMHYDAVYLLIGVGMDGSTVLCLYGGKFSKLIKSRNPGYAVTNSLFSIRHLTA